MFSVKKLTSLLKHKGISNNNNFESRCETINEERITSKYSVQTKVEYDFNNNEEQLENKNNEINILQQKLGNKDHELKILQQQLGNKDNEIKFLRNEYRLSSCILRALFHLTFQ